MTDYNLEQFVFNVNDEGIHYFFVDYLHIKQGDTIDGEPIPLEIINASLDLNRASEVLHRWVVELEEGLEG